MRKQVDKKDFIKAIHNLCLNEELELFVKYDDGHEDEYRFRKINFMDNIIVLYGYLGDNTIGVIQDTYSMTKNEILEELWTGDLSDYDKNKVYIQFTILNKSINEPEYGGC